MIKFGIIAFLAFLLMGVAVNAQSGRVLVQNDINNSATQTSIHVKWYAAGILFPEGVNVYRREEGRTSWIKLNGSPISRRYGISEAEIARDSSMALFTELVNEGGWDTFNEGGFLELNAMIKSFSSAIYADYLGIYFVDYAAVSGTTYRYRIQKYQNGTETLVGQSNPIQAGPFQPGQGVSGFEGEQEDLSIKLDWEINEELFYGVNIYRSKNDSAFVKLNKNPFVVSQVEKSGALEYPSPKFVDQNLEEEVDYVYYIKGVDFFNSETQATTNLSLTLNDVTPPMPPKYLEKELDTMEVRLRWVYPEGDDVQTQRLFRGPSSDGPFESIFESKSATDYTDSLAIPGPYFYYVSSFDYSNNEASSRMVFADIKDLEPPMSPTGVTVKTDTGQYIIEWKENTEPDLLHYRVFRKANSQSKSGAFLLLPVFPEEITYQYRLPKNTLNAMSFYVVAVDTSENISEPSEIVTAQMPDIVPPQAPQFRGVDQSDDDLVISWYRNVEPDLLGYQLYRADSLKPVNFQQINRKMLSPTVFEYTDRNMEFNKGYLYRLMAQDSAGNTSMSSPKYAIYEKESKDVAGSINVNLKYRKRRKTNTLSWSQVEMKDWLGYVIFKGSASNALRPITSLTKDLQFKDTDLNSTVFYQIKAYSRDGTIIESEILEWEK